VDLTQLAVEEATSAVRGSQRDHRDRFRLHIIQVIERDENKALTSEARQTLGRKALQSWLDEQRQSAQIEELVP
jgi:hypothetical protein